MFPIPSLQCVHAYSDKHVISKCTIRNLLSANIVNWEYNRPPDQTRCQSIAENIYMRRNDLDWFIYMIYDKPKNCFYIIDGIHRVTALRIIYNENNKPDDFITPNPFGSNGDAHWLYDMHILVSMKINPTKGEAIDWFQTINNSNPVPELYIENKSEIKRKIIEDIVKEWTLQYKCHFTSSQKPNIPNINRDRFIDLLCEIYDHFNMAEMTAYQQINEKLYEVNNYIRENIPKKVNKNAIDKCYQSGCFLFLLPRDVLLEHIYSTQ